MGSKRKLCNAKLAYRHTIRITRANLLPPALASQTRANYCHPTLNALNGYRNLELRDPRTSRCPLAWLTLAHPGVPSRRTPLFVLDTSSDLLRQPQTPQTASDLLAGKSKRLHGGRRSAQICGRNKRPKGKKPHYQSFRHVERVRKRLIDSTYLGSRASDDRP